MYMCYWLLHMSCGGFFFAALYIFFFFFFFFSSRRRHTRCLSDWSSDVCSSDLRPGSNATGVNFFTMELMAKRMQLLHELVPSAKRVAVLVNPTDRSNESTLRDVETAAIGQQVLAFEAATGRQIDECSRKSTPFLSLEALSSPHGACSSPFWRHAMRSLQHIRNALLSKPVG